jgi:predicted nucleic acid-binding protein
VNRVLVDSNVLLDVLTEDPAWFEWSEDALSTCAEQAVLAINPIIYAEVAAGFRSKEDLDTALSADRFQREALPWDAAFLASKSFIQYRRRGGERRSPLPDFYIGAHAAVAGMTLLTRDASRYRTYFPTLPILAPQ